MFVLQTKDFSKNLGIVIGLSKGKHSHWWWNYALP